MGTVFNALQKWIENRALVLFRCTDDDDKVTVNLLELRYIS